MKRTQRFMHMPFANIEWLLFYYQFISKTWIFGSEKCKSQSYLQILMYLFRFALGPARLNDNPKILINIVRQIVCLVFSSWIGKHKITRDILGLINNWYNSWWIILVHLIIVPLTTGAPYVNCYQLIIWQNQTMSSHFEIHKHNIGVHQHVKSQI